jgi:uncharacterized membrane protein
MNGEDAGDGDDGGPVTAVTVFVILGAGFVALVLDVEWFWAIWVVGFAAVLPVVAILEDRIYRAIRGGKRYEPAHHRDARRSREDEAEDALEALKRRYAEGEIDEIEFEERLEALIENESIEDVRHRLDDDRTGERERDWDREYDLE